MRQADQARAFMFEGLGIRGRLVRMDQTWREIIARHDYSTDVAGLLGEAAAAGVLLADNLKGRGSVHLQIQGEGDVRLLLVQCEAQLNVRALARGGNVAGSGSMRELLGEGRMMVTIDPGPGQERYQGIVPLAGATLSESLEGYFRDSEQLLTRLWLGVVGGSAVGLMLQRMPEVAGSEDDWHTLGVLADTVRTGELAELPAADLLRRLFAGYDIRLFDARPIGYDCRCTDEHLHNVIRLLGDREVNSVLEEQGRLELNCEFCNKSFSFAPEQARQALRGSSDESQLH
ncbi:MAG: Hsp33 family molecular chaperone HslO [Gammaproteobacteria bacterium]|nr:Hsp33 family molecular chaperone HslO [Gammaproteobacteria bacterium]